MTEYDPAGDEVGEVPGAAISAARSESAINSGRAIATNGGSGNVALFGPPATPSDPAYDSPLAIDSVRGVEDRRTADFQTTPDGGFAAFPSSRPLTGRDSDDHYEVFRHAAGGELSCVSCNPTGLSPAAGSTLATNGLSLTGDGRVFFTTGEPLVRRDTNQKKDAYEWSEGAPELISTGQSPFDSGLLSVSAGGANAFFFTRETLAANDGNGNLMSSTPPAKAAASSSSRRHRDASPPTSATAPAAPGPSRRSMPPVPGPAAATSPTPKPCRKGYVQRNGKCVKRKKSKKHGKHQKRQHWGGRHG